MYHLIGGNHDFASLDKLVSFLTSQIDNLKSDVTEREKNLEDLFKLTSKTICDYDNETAAMIRKIHRTADQEVHFVSQFNLLQLYIFVENIK